VDPRRCQQLGGHRLGGLGVLGGAGRQPGHVDQPVVALEGGEEDLEG
jgi:hypothetical protein